MRAATQRSVRRRGRMLEREGMRGMASGMRELLEAIERGELVAPAGLVARLQGAVLALDALDERGAPHATKAAMVDTASLLRLLAAFVDSGQLEADPSMARGLEGAADALDGAAGLARP